MYVLYLQCIPNFHFALKVIAFFLSKYFRSCRTDFSSNFISWEFFHPLPKPSFSIMEYIFVSSVSIFHFPIIANFVQSMTRIKCHEIQIFFTKNHIFCHLTGIVFPRTKKENCHRSPIIQSYNWMG